MDDKNKGPTSGNKSKSGARVVQFPDVLKKVRPLRPGERPDLEALFETIDDSQDSLVEVLEMIGGVIAFLGDRPEEITTKEEMREVIAHIESALGVLSETNRRTKRLLDQ